MSEDTLWEIVDLLDQGDVVYFHRENGELLSHPDPKRWEYTEYEEQIEEVKTRVDAQPEQYIAIEPPEPKEAFYIMEAFLNNVQDEHLKRHLTEALHSKKPFRYFRTAVEDSAMREDWLDFKDAWMKMWVTDKLEGMGLKGG